MQPAINDHSPRGMIFPFTCRASWMRVLNDDLIITAVSLPGTHDSCAIIGHHRVDPSTSLVWGVDHLYNSTFTHFRRELFQTLHGLLPLLDMTTCCQAFTLKEQLRMGIRVFDIRLARDSTLKQTVRVFHGPFSFNDTFLSIMQTIAAFLKAHPSEFVIMSLKGEWCDNLGDLVKDEGIPLLETHAYHIKVDAAFPTVGEVRGKVIVLNRYSARIHSSLNPPTEFEGVRGGLAEDRFGPRLSYHVQDVYNVASNKLEDKKRSILDHMNVFAEGNWLSINFASCIGTQGREKMPASARASISKVCDLVDLASPEGVTVERVCSAAALVLAHFGIPAPSLALPNPRAAADVINPFVHDVISQPTAHVGILMMDFVTPDLVAAVVAKNGITLGQYIAPPTSLADAIAPVISFGMELWTMYEKAPPKESGGMLITGILTFSMAVTSTIANFQRRSAVLR